MKKSGNGKSLDDYCLISFVGLPFLSYFYVILND